MDIKTLLFMLAMSNLVFGLELILFQLREQQSPNNPYWIAAKILQCIGWLFLAGRGVVPDALYIPVGNGAILCGLAYEGWAMFQISGRPVSRTLHGATTAGIMLICILFTPLPAPHRIVITSLMAALFFGVSGWAMLSGPDDKSLLQRYLGWNMWLIVVIQGCRVWWVLYAPPEGVHLFTPNLVQTVAFGGYFYIVLTNGFGMLLLTREATDRKLNRVLAEQKTILETLPTGLCILRDRQIERCNPAMEAMFRFAPGTLTGRSARCLYESDEAYAGYGRTIYSKIERSGYFEGETAVMRQNGQRFWVKAQGAPLFPHRPGDSVVFSITDITEQIRQQETLIRQKEALAEARDQAEAANRAKSEFLANMSHEIRTPLNAILGFAQVLGCDPDINDAQRDRLTTIQRSGEHLLTLINGILDMAKIEAGRMTLQTAPFDLARLLTETAALFQPRAHDRGLTLTIEAAELPRRVDGDEMKLRQVLINLIGNAVKFTPAGTVTLRVEKAGDDAIRFNVIDTGMGIAPEELALLFTPFTQTETGRSIQGGTGLGLALSSQFIRLMGGKLTADSTPGQGSCFAFTLSLPPVAGLGPAMVQIEHPIVSLEPGQPVCRILIVDDLPDNREPLRALLNGLNPQPPVLEFREAADGREAVAIWEAWQPQVIFMDMRMPVLSGEEATQQIKALMAARPEAVRSVVVALTASAFEQNRDRFLACGCDEFARKPLVTEELFAILEQRAGLRFVRAAELTVDERLSPDTVVARLAACPEAWRAALKDAVNLGDFGRIAALLEQIRNSDAALYGALTRWAYNYDLETFTILCSRIQDHYRPNP